MYNFPMIDQVMSLLRVIVTFMEKEKSEYPLVHQLACSKLSNGLYSIVILLGTTGPRRRLTRVRDDLGSYIPYSPNVSSSHQGRSHAGHDSLGGSEVYFMGNVSPHSPRTTRARATGQTGVLSLWKGFFIRELSRKRIA